MIVSARIFFVGGVTSFRALFYWLTPWIYVPTMLIAPLFQILLFAYIGRSAGLESDKFYLIGNALQYASIPCLFAMSRRSAASASRTRSARSWSARRRGSRSSSGGRCLWC